MTLRRSIHIIFVFFISTFCFDVSANSENYIRQGVVGHSSMSQSSCVKIARSICESTLANCQTFASGSAHFTDTTSIGLECTQLDYGIRLLIIFGATSGGQSEQNKFDDNISRLYRQAYSAFN